MPALRAIDCFHDDPGYIKALRADVNDYWMKHGRPDLLVLSFHGLPRRTLDLGDPYHCQCQKTARLLARELGLDAKQYVVTFQSRFGRARVAQARTPRTRSSRLAKEGKARVDVVCPGFVADCLETLEEIGIEGEAGVPRRRRQGVPRDSLPQRAPAVDRRARRPRRAKSAGLARARRPTRRPAS